MSLHAVDDRRPRRPELEPARLTDEDVVVRILAGETALFEILMRRHNQRLFRTIRVLVRDDAEAEEILQEAYVRAYTHLGQFERRARFSTWLTRIAIHEAFARGRTRSRFVSLDTPRDETDRADERPSSSPTPEKLTETHELRSVLEAAIAGMPETLRLVFVLREVEGLDTRETASCLGLSVANVKVRLHRARASLRADIERRLGDGARRLHAFGAERCDRVVSAVLERLVAVPGPTTPRAPSEASSGTIERVP